MTVPQTNDPIISVRDLHKIYPKSLTPSVNGISFDVMPGTVVGLLGGNGAGKTTTLSMLIGVLTPTSGSIHILGMDMAQQRRDILAKMNFASPYVDMPHRMTLRENLTVFCRFYNVRNKDAHIMDVARDLDLVPFLDRLYGSLSAGQKTRAAMAKALINKPRLLLLDEPTASLDPDTADWVRGYVMEYARKENATVVLASHNMSEVERMCDDVIMMKQGRVVDHATPEMMREKYGLSTMEDVFLHIARTLDIDAEVSL